MPLALFPKIAAKKTLRLEMMAPKAQRPPYRAASLSLGSASGGFF
jgi:hypothetical protein